MNLRSVKSHIYTQKNRWKWLIIAVAIIIIGISLWYTNKMVSEFANDERRNIRLWAEATKKKADYVNYTERLFSQLKKEEKKRAQLLTYAYEIALDGNNESQYLYILNIIESNEHIPVVITKGDVILAKKNFDDTATLFRGKIKKEFSQYPPLQIKQVGQQLYYKDSKVFAELKQFLNTVVNNFFNDISQNFASVPVIITDKSRKNIISYGNLDDKKMKDPNYVAEVLDQMESENVPIEIDFLDQGKTYIFYFDSPFLRELKYYPIVQFCIIGIFIIIAYFIFSTSRKSEQNQVWIGMSKETAHQLGTPLSSLIGWTELLRLENVSEDVLSEIEKDLDRLQKITERFSKVGSPPELKDMNLNEELAEAVNYLRPRTSSKVKYSLKTPSYAIIIPLNKHLFAWVIENICKNAIDAMGSHRGKITITVTDELKQVFIDIKDTGKGLPKSKFKTIFNPGYTSKKRGWGLGLSLTRRIIKNYHKGKIFVKTSVIDGGTTFRIILKKEIS